MSQWETPHVPDVLAVDAEVGARLLEAIRPGTSLAESGRYASATAVADLMVSLHVRPTPTSRYGAVGERVSYLFDAHPGRRERRAVLHGHRAGASGRRAASRLATDPVSAVLLHGDLTPPNILDGGPARGLVAIDPAPCLGDPAFDAVDLLLWRATP